ncbi:MAG: ABC transporter permease subunit [Anaerolineales bacterium]|nr:ABC transporter permease subunit [Anaerolineales bacterium]
MSSRAPWRNIYKNIKTTVFYIFVATITLSIIGPVFFVVSLSFLSTREAYDYPLPLLPALSTQFHMTHGERGYLLSVYDRVNKEYITVIDTLDLEKMSVYMKARLGTPVSIGEIEEQVARLDREDPVYFTKNADVFHNYKVFFQITRDAIPSLIRSLQICGLTILISLSIGGMAGYAFARYVFVGREMLKFSVLFVRMFPAIAIALPMVIILANMGFYDRPIGLSLVYSLGNIALTVWITASIFMGIPVSLEEAAQVFGGTRAQAFLRITLPLALPGLAAAAMYAFLGAWNEVVSALVLTELNPTFSVVVYKSLVGATGQVNLSAAGGIVMAIPTVTFTYFIRRYIQQMWGGITL